MPSPFPGMNPYLESPDIWEDFHQNLAVEIQAQLAPRLRPKYIAAVEPRFTYDEIVIQSPAREVKPDVGVLVQDSWMRVPASGTAVMEPPITLSIPEEAPLKLWTVEIRAARMGTLVTSIEILSPVNKRPSHEAFASYHRKRQSLMRAGVNWLEIDLLRAGTRELPYVTEKLPRAPYFVFLWRERRPRDIGIYPLSLRSPIPPIPVPLREPDPDVPLNLPTAIQSIYERASYDLRIDYSQPPPKPDFPPEDAAWIQQQVASFA